MNSSARFFAVVSLRLLVVVALVPAVVACAGTRRTVVPRTASVLSLYDGYLWTGYSTLDEAPDALAPESALRYELDDYQCRTQSVTLSEKLEGFSMAARLFEQAAAAAKEQPAPPITTDSEPDESQVPTDPSFAIVVDVTQDPEAYRSCMSARAWTPQNNAQGPFLLADLASCWRFPNDPQACKRALQNTEAATRDDTIPWFVHYNALVGACLQKDTESCNRAAALEAEIEAFERRQIELRISREDYYQSAEPPPSWSLFGTRSWARECETGCAWCCLLSARWHAYALGGEPDRAPEYLAKACDLEPNYCTDK